MRSKPFLIFLAFLACLVVGGYWFKMSGHKKIREETMNQPVADTLTVHEFASKAEAENTLRLFEGQYIVITGDLIDVSSTERTDGTTVFLTSGVQTDSSYLVGYKLVPGEAKAFSCDSLITAYKKFYRMTENPVRVSFLCTVYNDMEDPVLSKKYFPQCNEERVHGEENFLEHFCLERATVKAKVISMNREHGYLEVFLDDGVLLSRDWNKKKIFGE